MRTLDSYAFSCHIMILCGIAPKRPVISLATGQPCHGSCARLALRVQATAAPETDCCPITDWQSSISPEKRQTLNLLLAAAVSLPTASLLGVYATSFVPHR